MPCEFLRAPPSSVQKYSGLIRKTWFIVMVIIVRVRSEQKPSSDLFCISDCSTSPLVCSGSPPPQILITTPHPPPPSATAPPPPPPPPPPFKPYNTPPSGLAQPQPTVISAPHDFSYPYYYFYASAASSLSLHASLFAFSFSLVAYSILGT